jgi:hypothetical protein
LTARTAHKSYVESAEKAVGNALTISTLRPQILSRLKQEFARNASSSAEHAGSGSVKNVPALVMFD